MHTIQFAVFKINFSKERFKLNQKEKKKYKIAIPLGKLTILHILEAIKILSRKQMVNRSQGLK